MAHFKCGKNNKSTLRRYIIPEVIHIQVSRGTVSRALSEWRSPILRINFLGKKSAEGISIWRQHIQGCFWWRACDTFASRAREVYGNIYRGDVAARETRLLARRSRPSIGSVPSLHARHICMYVRMNVVERGRLKGEQRGYPSIDDTSRWFRGSRRVRPPPSFL